MSFANAIRIVLVIGWLALFGSHALHHARPAPGLRESRDFAAGATADPGRSRTDQRLAAAIGALLPPSAGARDRRPTLALGETLGDGLQQVRVEAQGNAHGRTIRAGRRVGGAGLGCASAPSTLGEIGAGTTRDLEAALGLPPGLRAGGSFASFSRQRGAQLAQLRERIDDRADPAATRWPAPS